MSKLVTFEVFTGSTQIKKSFEVHSQLGANKIIGTSINSIFEFNERLRKYKASHIKANELVSVVISVDESPIVDSYKLNSEYGFKLKFGSSAKSKRKFASCLSDLISWSIEDVKTMTIEELIKSLED